jgi:hypothetical protein
MTAPPVIARSMAVVAAGAAAAAVAYAARAELFAALLPPIGWVVDALLPDGIARTALAVVHTGGPELIALDTALTRPLQARGGLVPAGETVRATTLAAYVLQQATLIYAVLAAWPIDAARARATVLLLGVPAVAVATLLDIPFVLAGLVHDLLLEAGAAETGSRGLAVYYEFLHRGGRAGISVAVGVAVALPFGTQRGAEPRPGEEARGAARIERSCSGEIGERAGAAQQPPAFE